MRVNGPQQDEIAYLDPVSKPLDLLPTVLAALFGGAMVLGGALWASEFLTSGQPGGIVAGLGMLLFTPFIAVAVGGMTFWGYSSLVEALRRVIPEARNQWRKSRA
jgi:hypothetical protein